MRHGFKGLLCQQQSWNRYFKTPTVQWWFLIFVLIENTVPVQTKVELYHPEATGASHYYFSSSSYQTVFNSTHKTWVKRQPVEDFGSRLFQNDNVTICRIRACRCVRSRWVSRREKLNHCGSTVLGFKNWLFLEELDGYLKTILFRDCVKFWETCRNCLRRGYFLVTYIFILQSLVISKIVANFCPD